jgi:hypothetical protein
VQHYLWRAVDQDGVVLDILGPPRRQRRKALLQTIAKGLFGLAPISWMGESLGLLHLS